MTLPGEFKHCIVNYTTDDGILLTVSQKKQLAEIVNNPITLIRGKAQGIAERGRLRTITIATIHGGTYFKREIVICRVDNPLWRGSQKTVTIQGVTWFVIERRGEYRRGPFAT